MIVVIDNYDSFTYNLVQYLGELGAEMAVFRNDQVTVADVEKLRPSHVVISPGPGRPDDGGVSNDLIRSLSAHTPTLGVCLGHQCAGHVFGGRVVRASRLMHGKTSLIHHDARGLFRGLPNPFEATRYHSLVVVEPPEDAFEVSAWTAEGEIMGLRHRARPLEGLQFHPESILTQCGKQKLKNFLEMGSGIR